MRRDVDIVLRADPSSSDAYAIRGYLALHDGHVDESVAAFREALRLDPTNEFAEQWVIDALRGRGGISRLVQRYNLWTTRARSAKRATARVGIAALGRVPGVGALVYMMILWSWIATPVVQLGLMRDPFGRLLLRRADIIHGVVVGALVAFAITAFVLEAMTRSGRWALIGGASLALSIPVAQVRRMQPGWPRRVVFTWALACAIAAGLAAFFAAVVPSDINWRSLSSNSSPAVPPFEIEVFAVLILLFVANRLATVDPRRF